MEAWPIAGCSNIVALRGMYSDLKEPQPTPTPQGAQPDLTAIAKVQGQNIARQIREQAQSYGWRFAICALPPSLPSKTGNSGFNAAEYGLLEVGAYIVENGTSSSNNRGMNIWVIPNPRYGAAGQDGRIPHKEPAALEAEFNSINRKTAFEQMGMVSTKEGDPLFKGWPLGKVVKPKKKKPKQSWKAKYEALVKKTKKTKRR